MRILFLSQVLPYPLDAGPKIRMYYVLRYLSQYHRVTLLSFLRSADELEHVAELNRLCEEVETIPLRRSPARDAWHLVRSGLNGQPFLVARDAVQEMTNAVKRSVGTGSFDAVHADQLSMAQYAAPQRGLKKVLDQHNAVWTIVYRMWQNERPGIRRWLEAVEWRKLRHYEIEIVRRFDRVVTVTDEDRQALEPKAGSQPSITVIPICIDTAERGQLERNPAAKHIICVGGMFYPPNVDGVLWFGREVFPIVRRECPEADFLIVGARPDKRLLELAGEDSKIRIIGYVKDTTTYLRDSAVFVVPLRAGAGMRVKILDAWASGIPIVSTTLGSEGIQVRPDENLLIADTPSEFAQCVLRLLRDRTMAQGLADNGRRWVQARYDWRIAYQKFDEIYPH